MGLAKGNQPLPFGHRAQAAVDIEGLVVSAGNIVSNSTPIDVISCWKIIFGNSEKKKMQVREKMKMKPSGIAGTSSPTPRRNQNQRGGWMWTLGERIILR